MGAEPHEGEPTEWATSLCDDVSEALSEVASSRPVSSAATTLVGMDLPPPVPLQIVRFNLGLTLLDLDDHEEAIKAFDACVNEREGGDREDVHCMALENLGDALIKLNRHEEALSS